MGLLKAELPAQLAVKALLKLIGRVSWRRDPVYLYRQAEERLGIQSGEKVLDCARFLARLYIPTRYPDALPGGTPSDHFGRSDASKAVECAEVILGWVVRAAKNVMGEAEG